MRERIAALADVAWRGLDATAELQQLLRENVDNPEAPGPTEVSELSDFLWRPEHVSRIAHGEPPKRRRRQRRVAADSRPPLAAD